MRTSPNRILGLILGVLFLVAGAAGFLVTSGLGPFDQQGAPLLGLLRVNPVHNIAHLVIGLGLGAAALAGVRWSRPLNIGVGAAYLLLGMFGLFAVGTDANVLAINGGDNVLHFASATLLLAVGLGAERPERPSPTRA